MNNETTNTPPFKVKCIDIESFYLTVGKEYDVAEVDEGFYKVKNDSGRTQWYYDSRFQIVETPPKDKQEFSVGDEVVINKISSGYVPSVDKNVKVGDIATVIKVSGGDLKLSNTNWKNSWWFSKDDVSLVGDASPLSHQEVVQAVIYGKELEMQYKTGTWVNVIPMNTTLHQLANLNFRLKQSLEDKRKAVIKKLLESKVAVLCKCWDDDDSNSAIVAVTSIDDDFVHPYLTDNSAYKNAYIIDDNGNEITNVE